VNENIILALVYNDDFVKPRRTVLAQQINLNVETFFAVAVGYL
jgi:hypothetical protein